MEVPDRAAGPSPSDFSLSGVFSGLSCCESRNEERENPMLSSVVLAPVSELWPGAGQDGPPSPPRPAQLAWWVSVQFSRSVVSDCLRPHGLQHARFLRLI